MQTYEDYGKKVKLLPIPTHLDRNRDGSIFHVHPHYELMIVPHPVSTETAINGVSIRTDTPIAVLTAPWCMHFSLFRDGVKPGTKHYVFYFSEELLERFGDGVVPVGRMLDGKSATFFDLTDQVEDVFNLLKAASRYGTCGIRPSSEEESNCVGRELMLVSILNLINDFCPTTQRRTVSKEHQGYISRVIMYLVQNPNADLRIPQLAELFFVSRDKLCRDFQKVMHMTLGDFIVQIRLNTAKLLLRKKKATVKEVACQVGFENDIYFYSFFKKHTGLTPKEYRNAN